MTECQEKILHGKNILDFEIFGLKKVLKHKSIPTKKKIFDQNFCLCHFFTTFGHFGQKTTESQEKTLHGKHFQFREFRFEIGFKTFWIDSDQKNFDQIFWLCHFFAILAEKGEFQEKNFTWEKPSI